MLITSQVCFKFNPNEERFHVVQCFTLKSSGWHSQTWVVFTK